MLALSELFSKPRRSARSYAELLPWFGSVAPGLVLCQDGSLLAGFACQGEDVEGREDFFVDQRIDLLEAALRTLNDRCTLWSVQERRFTAGYPAGEFASPVARAIDRAWERSCAQRRNARLTQRLLAHRPGYLDQHKAIEAINRSLGLEIPTVGARTQRLMQVVLALDEARLTAALQHLPAHVSGDMPIDDVVGLLQALGVELAEHWKVNETFFDTLTRTELDAVCGEIGLAAAAGTQYAGFRSGSKKDFVKAMLAVDGFDYRGAVPQIMRWDAGA